MTTGATAPIRHNEAVESAVPEVSVVMPCLNEADTLAKLHREGPRSPDARRHRGRDRGRRQRQHRRFAARSPRRLGRSCRARLRARLRERAARRDRGGARALRPHGRRRRQLRLHRDSIASWRRCATEPNWCRDAGSPSGGGTVRPGRHAVPAPGVGQPDVLVPRASLVRRPDPRHLLRHARRSAPTFRGSLDLRCTGMEFATEMIIKATLCGRAHQRGADHAVARRPRRPRARTCGPSATAGARCASSWSTARAGSSSCRACCSSWPGSAGYAVAMPGLQVARGRLRRAHPAVREPGDRVRATSRCCSPFFTKIFAISEGLAAGGRPRWTRLYESLNLEKGHRGREGLDARRHRAHCCLPSKTGDARGFGPLDYARTMRRVIPGITLVTLGVPDGPRRASSFASSGSRRR